MRPALPLALVSLLLLLPVAAADGPTRDPIAFLGAQLGPGNPVDQVFDQVCPGTSCEAACTSGLDGLIWTCGSTVDFPLACVKMDGPLACPEDVSDYVLVVDPAHPTHPGGNFGPFIGSILSVINSG